jgi:acetoin utilization deacetylase AcuC-like enzyme
MEKENFKQRPETIRQRITTVRQAKELIFDVAREGVSSLDWKSFGVSNPEESFDQLFPQLIHNLPKSQIGVFDGNNDSGAEAIRLTQEEYKMPIGKDKRYWLVMYEDIISPVYANFLRDYLLLQAPIDIAKAKQLPVMDVIRSFRDNNPHIKKIAKKMMFQAAPGLSETYLSA